MYLKYFVCWSQRRALCTVFSVRQELKFYLIWVKVFATTGEGTMNVLGKQAIFYVLKMGSAVRCLAVRIAASCVEYSQHLQTRVPCRVIETYHYYGGFDLTRFNKHS